MRLLVECRPSYRPLIDVILSTLRFFPGLLLLPAFFVSYLSPPLTLRTCSSDIHGPEIDDGAPEASYLIYLALPAAFLWSCDNRHKSDILTYSCEFLPCSLLWFERHFSVLSGLGLVVTLNDIQAVLHVDNLDNGFERRYSTIIHGFFVYTVIFNCFWHLNLCSTYLLCCWQCWHPYFLYI